MAVKTEEAAKTLAHQYACLSCFLYDKKVNCKTQKEKKKEFDNVRKFFVAFYGVKLSIETILWETTSQFISLYVLSAEVVSRQSREGLYEYFSKNYNFNCFRKNFRCFWLVKIKSADTRIQLSPGKLNIVWILRIQQPVVKASYVNVFKLLPQGERSVMKYTPKQSYRYFSSS